MRFSKIVVVCICLLGLTQPARSQQTEGGQKKEGAAEQGIPGYLDPRTGAFKPMAKAPLEESEIEVLTPTAGDFQVTFKITVKSSLPSTAKVSCTFSAIVQDTKSLLTMTDSMTVAATGSGGSRSCTLDMFYSWPLSSPSTDTAMLSYSIDALGGTSGTLDRSSTQTLPSKTPAPSGQTMITINATI